MPIARVKMEDGRVARFRVPEGTTPERATALARDHFAQLLTGRNVSQAYFAQVRKIEQGQPLGEEFTIDDSFAKAGDHAKADAAGKFV